MKDRFVITVHGKKSHGSAPHLGQDAVVAAAAVVQALQILASRVNNPNDTFVLTIGKMNGGTKENIISDEVVLEGMAEVENPDFRISLPERIEKMAQCVAAAYDCTARCEYEKEA